MQDATPYAPQTKIRIVTGTSLFDGHDAAIGVMRRILQSTGAEVIHLGHNRSVDDFVSTVIQEDAQAVAITSYQGGHIEFFKYLRDKLDRAGFSHVRIFGGGGGVILPTEAAEIEAFGVTKIYTPDDGRRMGLQGMINHLLQNSDFPLYDHLPEDWSSVSAKDTAKLSRLLTILEAGPTASHYPALQTWLQSKPKNSSPVIGITGTGGAGKSSLIDELLRRFLLDQPQLKIAILSVDPTKRKTGGALLGDRIRMNSIYQFDSFMRSLATRQSHGSLAKSIGEALSLVRRVGFDFVILESSGIGQSNSEIADFADFNLYVMTPEYGAASQLEKIDMIDFADMILVNKSDKRGAKDAVHHVQKQFIRSHKRFSDKLENTPVFGTTASQFGDTGTTAAYLFLAQQLHARFQIPLQESIFKQLHTGFSSTILPAARIRYLSEISETLRDYDRKAFTQGQAAQKYCALVESSEIIPDATLKKTLLAEAKKIATTIEPSLLDALQQWDKTVQSYADPVFSYPVRGQVVSVETHTQSLSHLSIPKVTLPSYSSWSDRAQWLLQENVPGQFPYTAGVFPFKRENEDPTRMFAGEGGPERTNRRFHYVSEGMPARRLSTAFDSVTLYGENPARRPDIYGKIGNSGVSISCLDDAKRLYSGFDLCDPKTSVSMTINGPAPLLLGFFLNTAIDQQCEKYLIEKGLVEKTKATIQARYQALGLAAPKYSGPLPKGNNGLGLLLLGASGEDFVPAEIYAKIKAAALQSVRGTVQADILKEDQAQNTCIFSTEFALKLMGDIQEYFVQNQIKNFYSISISGYHIAEAGANPITQLALTLANGFTYVEYFLSRGVPIDAFAPNLSFFFSNGLDPEYAVLGRVARRIWAKALKLKYGAAARSQMLKYHIQTSGRSLHAQEISFNDIRTTLQALYAIVDNCNSLHTNAYDEAITTPTEESVRRAMAIQLIINHELGLTKNQNPFQGSFFIEKLTDIVEKAVLEEFDRITERGGVLGAMETLYQRSKIQEESLYYEELKHSGKLPVIGVNTFLSKEGSPTSIPSEVIRSTQEEKENQIQTVALVKAAAGPKGAAALAQLAQDAVQGKNLFGTIMEASRYCTLGDLTTCLYSVGGQYRRNM